MSYIIIYANLALKNDNANENFILREYSRFEFLQFLILEDNKIYKIKYCDASKTKKKENIVY